MLRLTRRELFDEPCAPFAAREISAWRATPVMTAEAVKIIFFLDGHAMVRSPAATHQMVAGDVLTLSEGAWFAADPVLPSRAITLYIDVDFLRASARWIPPGHPLKSALQKALTHCLPATNVRFEADVMRALTPALQRIVRATSHSEAPYSVLQASGSLFARMAKHAPVVPASPSSALPRPNAIVVRAVTQVVLDPSRRWSVRDLAATVAISESQLTRLFRQELGTTPATLVREQRISEMARLLSMNETGIAQAARQAGWRNASSASRAFKRRYGASPRVYRDRTAVSCDGIHDPDPS